MSEAVSARALADELVRVYEEQEPTMPTLFGFDGAHDRLGDLSVAAEQDFIARYADVAERAAALDPAGLTPDERTTRAVVIQQAKTRIDVLTSRQVEHVVTDLFVAPAAVLLTALPMIGLPTPELAEAYLRRLGAIPAHLAGAADRHRAGVVSGRVPVAHLVEAAIKHIDRYLADPDNDPLTRPAPPAGVADDFNRRRDAVLADVVRPAFATYRDVLINDVLPHGRPADRPGLTWLPGGDADYAALVRAHTTADRSPDELHETGLAIVEQLRAEYAELGQKVLGTDDLAEIFHRLRFDDSMRWQSADELLDAARQAIARAELAAPNWFSLRPRTGCEVLPVPAADAAGSPAAYYVPASLDGARPGVYYANTDQVTERFRHQCECTAFHEAVPGHHFQISIALEVPDLPMLRRIADVNAYSEGWGLYTERLADEMGLYSSDLSRLGMLTADSMRAGRLVVDTGLHAKGWSRAQAVEYLSANTPMAAVEIEAEVDRYIAYPGQALSYMVGRLEIQRIRAGAEAALGDRFDIRGFHDVVLGNGPLPLSVLAEVVGDWVAAQPA
ncbi:MAG TPA: DUF885 domain-containing protein [Pseudonocardiaceae bacterium]|jgi:uncharacterized protein (DUF885 family)|nr:DUF885 domain-containing protein [Pseudonocardiaceae bacterium]